MTVSPRLLLTALAALGLAGAASPIRGQTSADAGPPPGDQGSARARTHLVVGELARLDLARHVLVVKVKPREGDPREVEIETDGDTRISSRGRVLAFSELRPGERVLVSCTDQGTRHRAVLVKMGTPAKNPTPPSPAAKPTGP